MIIDSLQVADSSELTRHVLNPALRGTEFPGSPGDGNIFELTQPYLGNPAGIYMYVLAETKWVITHPNFDMLPYDVSGSVFGNMNDDDILMRHISVRSYRIKEAFSNCVAIATQAPTVDTPLKIIRSGRNGIETELGAITFLAAETVGVFSQIGSGDMSITAGETLIIKAPNPVNQDISDLAFTFAGALI